MQEHFVDRPDQAVGEADRLVTTLMSERPEMVPPSGPLTHSVAPVQLPSLPSALVRGLRPTVSAPAMALIVKGITSSLGAGGRASG